jgi:CHAT domain-containing protein/Tfp pilus assembly protein PilF
MSRRAEADNLNRLAVTLQAQGRIRESLSAFQRALEMFRDAGDTAGVGRCLNGVGALYKDLGELEQAKEYLEQALPFRRLTGDERGEAITLTTLGPVYAKLGQPEKASEVLMEALAITKAIFDVERYGQVLFNLAEVSLSLGEPWEAYRWLKEDLAIARVTGDVVEENKCLNLLTAIAYNLGQVRLAYRYGLESLALAQRLGNRRGESCALDNLGHIIQRFPVKDKWEQSLQLLEKSLAIDRETGVPAEAAVTMLSLAALHINTEKYAKARPLIDEAARIAEKAGLPALRGKAWHARGALHLKLNENQKARDCFDRTLDFNRRSGDRLSEAETLKDVALAFWDDGDELRALELLEEAASIFDNARSRIPDESQRISFFAQYLVQDVYHIYSARLLQLFERTSDRTYAERAFNVCERRHARELLDLLHSKGGDTGGTEIGASPVTLREVQTRLLDPDTAFLEYSIHFKVGYVWVVTRDDYEVHRIAIGGTEIREKVRKLRAVLESPEQTAYLEHASELYDLLLKPAARLIEGKRQLLIVPDDALQIVPFQALLTERPAGVVSTPPASRVLSALRNFVAPGRPLVTSTRRHADQPFLIKKYTVTYAPSAGIFILLKELLRARSETPPQKDFIAFAPINFGTTDAHDGGVKPLPYTRDEVKQIAALFAAGKATLVLGEEATKESLIRRDLSDYRFLHFATHAYFNHEDAETSTILLRGGRETDGHLYPFEVAALQLKAEMVTLSACETGLGEVTDEGILGLMRAFVCAGAATVCSSLWQVDDRATAELMRSFYHQLLVSKKGAAEALREAQIEFIQSNNWSSPRYWAPFILTGG